jgi:DNA-binding MarR family transcriptional regulator
LTTSIFSHIDSNDSVGFLLWKTTTSWQRSIKQALAPYDISHAQFVIMAIIHWFSEQNTKITQVMIINESRLDKMTVSKSLRLLSSKTLVARTENQNDTRAKYVTLTPDGIQLISKLVPIIEQIDKKFFGTLKSKDQKILAKYLNDLL